MNSLLIDEGEKFCVNTKNKTIAVLTKREIRVFKMLSDKIVKTIHLEKIKIYTPNNIFFNYEKNEIIVAYYNITILNMPRYEDNLENKIKFVEIDV
jgi:hypothetical protein